MKFCAFLAGLLAVGVLGVSSLSLAQPTREGAETLKPFLQDILDHQSLMHSIAGGAFKTTGPLSISPSGSYYAGKLPNLDMISADGVRTHVGPIILNIIPDPKNDALLGVSASIPVPIRNFDSSNQLTSALQIRDQGLRGVYHRDLMQFVVLDARYADLRLEDKGGRPFVTIPTLTAKANMVEDAQKRWSGPFEITLTDPVFKAGFAAGADTASFRLTSLGLDPVRYNAALAEFRREARARLDHQSTTQPDLSDAMLKFFTSALLTTASGVGYELALTRPTLTPVGSPPMQAAAINAALLLQGLGQGAVNLDLEANATDIVTSLTRIPFFPAPLPADIVLDTEIQRVPLDPFVTLLTLQSEAAQMPQGAQAAVAAYALTQFPKLLAQSGMRVNLKNLTLTHTDYEVNAEGQMSADPASIMGLTGAITVRLDGLDALLAQQALMLKANPADKSAQFGADVLKMLKLSGKDDPSRPQRLQYKVALLPDGSITLNDQSLISLWNRVRPATP